MFSKSLLNKTISKSRSTARFLSTKTLKPTSTAAAAEPSVSVPTSDDGYSTAAAAETPFLMSNSEAFVETLVSHSKFPDKSLLLIQNNGRSLCCHQRQSAD